VSGQVGIVWFHLFQLAAPVNLIAFKTLKTLIKYFHTVKGLISSVHLTFFKPMVNSKWHLQDK
jgi:hypothetical protein